MDAIILLRSWACVCCALGLAKIFFKRILTAFKSILTCSVYLYISAVKKLLNALKMAIKKNGVYLLAYAAEDIGSINQ